MPVHEFIEGLRGGDIGVINAHFDAMTKTKASGHYAKRRRKAGP